MKFSQRFRIQREQPELDFVDVDPDKDLPLFIDPYALAQRLDAWSVQCTEDVISFFEAAIDTIRAGRTVHARYLLENLSEPNDTCLGLSKGLPRGRGVSGKQALDLYAKLAQSQAVKTGVLTELADAELVIEGIGHDKVSDITTNIIRRRLIGYTQDQCRLHGIPLNGTVASGRLWDPLGGRWTQDHVQLPIVDGRRVLLVPKALVRWEMAIDHKEYYQHFVLNFLQKEELAAGSSLVQLLTNGQARVTKTSLQEKYPLRKQFLYQFTRDHPEVLAEYKRSKRDFVPVRDRDLTDDEIDEVLLAREMTARLREIPPGHAHAAAFHRLMIGILEFVLYPNLIYPVKEREIHDGRKRIDITYTNAALAGLFYRCAIAPDVAAKEVMVECKNYSHDPANPELDQISGRFSPTRGSLGLLVARRFDDRERFLERCRDTARDARGYVIPLADDDISRFLDLIETGQREQIEICLSSTYAKLQS